MLSRKTVFLAGAMFWLEFSLLVAANPELEYQPLSAEAKRIPQTLLSLIHAPEVQMELKLEPKKFASFMPVLQKIDGPWWRARILPEEKQRVITAQQENLLISELEKRFGTASVMRLRQLELQAQGYRMLIRPEVTAYLELSREQTQKLNALFETTDSVMAKIRAKMGQADAELSKQLESARTAEFQQSPKLLRPDQQMKVMQAIGKIFDTAKLQRIYPLAPELIDSPNWFGDDRPKLSQLRGKVVLVHFYAFQCHNCKANFHIYNRWQESLASKGVQLIGIQTPETSAESDPAAVSHAATQDGFKFPVLIDLQKSNWDAWSNTMWPTVYVIDKQGYVRFWWQGELNWQGATHDKTIEELVDKLLGEEIGSTAAISTATATR